MVGSRWSPPCVSSSGYDSAEVPSKQKKPKSKVKTKAKNRRVMTDAEREKNKEDCKRRRDSKKAISLGLAGKVEVLQREQEHMAMEIAKLRAEREAILSLLQESSA